MFVVDEETAEAIRRAWEAGGELRRIAMVVVPVVLPVTTGRLRRWRGPGGQRFRHSPRGVRDGRYRILRG